MTLVIIYSFLLVIKNIAFEQNQFCFLQVHQNMNFLIWFIDKTSTMRLTQRCELFNAKIGGSMPKTIIIIIILAYILLS